MRWASCLVLAAGLLLTSCATRPPRTLQEAQRLYQRRLARARGNPTLVPYTPQ